MLNKHKIVSTVHFFMKDETRNSIKYSEVKKITPNQYKSLSFVDIDKGEGYHNHQPHAVYSVSG